jgi:uncharacterized protein YbcI
VREEKGSLMADAATIAREIRQIHAEYYGQAPGKVNVYEAGVVVVVLIEETFTRAEQILIERGEAQEVQIIRRRFELTIAEEFKDIVQRATGRSVRAFLSDTDLHERLAVETFVLGGPADDMAEFEREGARADSDQAISDQSERERAFEPHDE